MINSHTSTSSSWPLQQLSSVVKTERAESSQKVVAGRPIKETFVHWNIGTIRWKNGKSIAFKSHLCRYKFWHGLALLEQTPIIHANRVGHCHHRFAMIIFIVMITDWDKCVHSSNCPLEVYHRVSGFTGSACSCKWFPSAYNTWEPMANWPTALTVNKL